MAAFALTQEPYRWNSPYYPVEFRFSHATAVTTHVITASGFAKFQMATIPTVVIVGDRLYVADGDYAGYHTITAISGTDVTTSTTFVADDIGRTVMYIHLPEIQVYKGYDTGGTYDTELPIELIATFTPVNSPDNDIYFDISGWLKRIFPQPAPASGTNFDLFNVFRLKMDYDYDGDIEFGEVYYVVNSAIKSLTLNEYYAETGRPLNTRSIPYLMDCGQNVVTTILSEHIATVIDDSSTIINP